MKRGGPIARRAALTSRTPLQAHVGLRRGGPPPPVSAKRRRDSVERRVVVSAMLALSDGRCPRCGQTGMALHGHERRGGSWRSQTMLRPDCLLDPICNSWAEDHPRVAAWTGWKISSKWPHDPSLTPTQALALDGSVVDFTAEAVAS